MSNSLAPSLEQEVLDRVFEPFFTTKEAGRGTGLGLATVYGIVQQNCGTIAIESTPRRGTTVRISLPFRSDSVVPKQPASVPDDLSGTETVMLVEDQEEVRRMAVRTPGVTATRYWKPGMAPPRWNWRNGTLAQSTSWLPMS